VVARAGEHIVLSGGPALRIWEKSKIRTHDVYWGNFVDAAVARLGQLKARARPGDGIAWLVYRPSYLRRSAEQQEDLSAIIRRKADSLGVALFWFDTKEELVNYLNTGRNRAAHPILSLDFFGHSNKVNWMFDYSNELDGCSTVFFHTRDLPRLNRGIFSREAVAQSWGCHSGEYHSKKFSDWTGVPMWGAIGKTDYSGGGLPVTSAANGKWSQ
jgi:hypothetical protein